MSDIASPEEVESKSRSEGEQYPFVHLHNHSDYSLLDGAVKVEWYGDRVSELGMKHIALTDHGNLFGAIHFQNACRAKGLNPIIGCEAYIAHSHRSDKAPDPRITSRKRYHYHMVLYCKNETGYRNLVQLVSRSNTEGFHYKPRMDHELLVKYHEGLMASSACLGGEIPQLILANQQEEAEKQAIFYRDLFGEGNFWLEVMRHGIPEEEVVLEAMKQISRNTGIPIIATNDVHYLRREHAEAHDALVCIGMKKVVTSTDRKRMKLDMPEFYLKTPKQMYELFHDMPEALANTVRLAEKCDLRLPEPGPILPIYEIPEGFSSAREFFCDLVWRSAEERYGELSADCEEGVENLGNKVYRRVEYELKTICELDFVGYFLIVWDFIRWARENGISVGPGRGSGAGSIIAYVLGITDVEPLQYNLLFERFLNTERVSMPDFDIDFCFERRGEVIEYVTRKYGKDNVAGICTFGTFKTKAVLKDIARVLDISFDESNYITSLVPDDAKNLEQALEKEPKLQEYREKGSQYQNLFDMSAILEGMSRHVSTHACGIVIGREPISHYVPLHKDKNNTLSTQFTMDLIEPCGLVKMDFLGLKTLTLLDKIENLVRKRIPDFSFRNIPEDDKITFDMLGRGESRAVFQFESDGMQKILVEAKPGSIEDLIALNALYRPGPMQFIDRFIESKKNPGRIQYPHEDLRETLEPTYGVIVYQEQVMEVARIIGGFSLGKADIMRRAMGKKKEKEMHSLKLEFIEGAVAKGYTKSLAEGIFEMLIPFAGYGFNKSHAAAYSILAYKTAYSRANFPTEFMAANLTNEIGNSGAFRSYINDLDRMGINLLPPDINLSERHFTVDETGRSIIFGLQGIKNVGGIVVEEIVLNRTQVGLYRGFLDFMERVDSRKVNRKTLETLINAGVFRKADTVYNQATMLHNLDYLCHTIGKKSNDGNAGLFDDCSEEVAIQIEMKEVSELPAGQILAGELELLSVYVSGHPLERYRRQWKRSSSLRMDRLNQTAGDKVYTVICMVRDKRIINTKQGKTMMTLELEDFYSSINAVIFPTALNKKLEDGTSYFDFLQQNNCIGLRANLEKRAGHSPQLIVEELFPIEKAPLKPNAELHLYVETEPGQPLLKDRQTAEDFRSLLYDYSGANQVFLHVRSTSPTDHSQIVEYVMELAPNIGISPSEALERDLLDSDLLPIREVEFV
ncbi:DNA polymerase III subunit alpha [Candidatus Haliotispira prima]|uniref:DNA polymerase III subunit alpha n=1 Tax=Candidatus Haliotispira prima TaxID=3034016 RepID=A0ABY8MIH6_9SPIO|nr:DNA polymerase III subunit alpha [Candidatus Haliotispira prima]